LNKSSGDSLFAVALLLVVLQDAFEVMLLPRRVHRHLRLTRFYFDHVWSAWSWLANRLQLACAGSPRPMLRIIGSADIVA
jgi:hypothetical protein